MKSDLVPVVRKRAENAFASGLRCAETAVPAITGAEAIESDLHRVRSRRTFAPIAAKSCNP